MKLEESREVIPLMENMINQIEEQQNLMAQMYQEMKQILVGFAEKIDIINMNNIPMQHTIELMKNKNQLQENVVEFIKNADLVCS